MGLHEFLVTNVFAFLLIFTRIGTAMMIMPGIGDTFVSTNIRLLFAVAVSFAMVPVLQGFLPAVPSTAAGFALLLGFETLTGIFIGTIMRIMMSAVDTAGMVIALQSGFGNALLFNPMLGAQGSVIGVLLSVMMITLMMAMNLHHLMLGAVFESYQLLPATGASLDTETMAQVIARIVSVSFATGVKMAIPFLILGLILYFAFGVLNKLLPQIQFFVLALPVQILMSIITLGFVVSAMAFYFVSVYEDTLVQTLVP